MKDKNTGVQRVTGVLCTLVDEISRTTAKFN